jgi:hypothetical protein
MKVTGTDYADFECQKCDQGFSQEGSDRCSLCGKDFYLNPSSGECMACPEGTHSLEGIIGTDPSTVCKPKRNCTMDEIPRLYSDKCVRSEEDNNLYKEFTLELEDFESEVCDVDELINEETLYQVPCGLCEAGSQQSINKEGEVSCESCPEGTSTTNSQKCESCGKGSYLVKGLELSKFEWFPSEYNFTTYCLSKDSQIKDSYCSESDGFLPIYEEGLQAGKREKVDSRVILVIDLEIVQDPKKKF